jgi:hypothetical protein
MLHGGRSAADATDSQTASHRRCLAVDNLAHRPGRWSTHPVLVGEVRSRPISYQLLRFGIGWSYEYAAFGTAWLAPKFWIQQGKHFDERYLVEIGVNGRKASTM